VANLPIGLFSDFKYQMQKTKMQPGSTLFIYTDGLTEARNAKHGLFGYERVEVLMSHCADMSPKELVDTVIAEVEQFAGDTEQSDDLTLLAIRYTPPENTLVLDEQVTLHNDVKEVSRLSTFIKDVMTRLGIGKPLAPKLRLALEEAVVNVMEYAYPRGEKGNIDIRATYDGEHLRLIISDNGIAFNPTKTASVDTTLTAEERPVGGLGILLMRELMDSVNYERIDGCNILTLTKRIEKQI
jgi:sigma-B regulation protein RsbU (phosphoserine phosphatase)